MVSGVLYMDLEMRYEASQVIYVAGHVLNGIMNDFRAEDGINCI